MFPDFSYLYEHRSGFEAQFTYFCLGLWWIVFWVAVIAGILLLVGLLLSPFLAFFFGLDLFHARRKDEKKREKKATRTRRKDSKTDLYIQKLDYAAKRK